MGREVVQLEDGRLLDDFHIEKRKQGVSLKLKEKKKKEREIHIIPSNIMVYKTNHHECIYTALIL